LSGDEFKQPNIGSTVLGLAELLRERLPELGDRMIAVSEMEVNRSNVPTMPIGMVALVDVTFRHAEKTNTAPWVVEQIIAEFWFKSNKVTSRDKTKESPFWAFYDYDPLLLKVVSAVLGWTTPKGYKLKITRMDLESDELAVHITFEFFHEYIFCPPVDEVGEPLRIIQHVRTKTECEPSQIKV
jgi:hypothetical protein